MIWVILPNILPEFQIIIGVSYCKVRDNFFHERVNAFQKIAFSDFWVVNFQIDFSMFYEYLQFLLSSFFSIVQVCDIICTIPSVGIRIFLTSSKEEVFVDLLTRISLSIINQESDFFVRSNIVRTTHLTKSISYLSLGISYTFYRNLDFQVVFEKVPRNWIHQFFFLRGKI